MDITELQAKLAESVNGLVSMPIESPSISIKIIARDVSRCAEDIYDFVKNEELVKAQASVPLPNPPN